MGVGAGGAGGVLTAGGGGAGGAPPPCSLCTGEQWCPEDTCECRPGLVADGAACIDPLTDPDDCGGATCGGPTPVCEGGTCVAACTGANTDCQDACVDLSNDALNCGRCGHTCNFDEVCAAGDCREMLVAGGCAACPCGDCNGDFDLCCVYPKTAQPICLKESPGCP